MGRADDLRSEVSKTFKSNWQTRAGRSVPTTADLPFDNQGVELDATVLYADLVESTALVRDEDPKFAAEIYKAYLVAVCRVVRFNDGVVTAFDGDRAMAVFVEGHRNLNAARAALQIAWAVESVLNPSLRSAYPSSTYRVRQAVGVDAGKMLVAKTGVRGSSDLVWTGLAANRAAKLCAYRDRPFSSMITSAVHASVVSSADLTRATDGSAVWNPFDWPQLGVVAYGSKCMHWPRE